MLGLSSVAGLGLVACVVYAAQLESALFASVLATSLIVACASAVVGAMLGFLFGIPRGVRGELQGASGAQPLPQQAQTGAEQQQRIAAGVRSNTNLEDISDWLTKILVGVGLTQLPAIADAGRNLARALEQPLGGTESSAAFGLGLAITFSATGFLIGYLWTRLTLPIAFQRAETEVEEELRRQLVASRRTQQRTAAAVLAAVDRPDVQADVLREVARTVSATATPSVPVSADRSEEILRREAAEYERVRREMPRGRDRTSEMTRVIAKARTIGQQQKPSPEMLRRVFDGSEGGRVVALALASATPDRDLVDIVLDGIRNSRSAFEQYHALRAAEAFVPILSPGDGKNLHDAIAEQMSPGGRIGDDQDRLTVAKRVLQLLEERLTTVPEEQVLTIEEGVPKEPIA
jgi:hypothetical protein